MSHSVRHLGHILTSNLSQTDSDGIERARKDFIREANCILHSYSSCNPQVKIRLLLNFCLCLSYLCSCPLTTGDTDAFNDVLRRIIPHSVAQLESIYNIVIQLSLCHQLKYPLYSVMSPLCLEAYLLQVLDITPCLAAAIRKYIS